VVRNRDNREKIQIGESFTGIFPELGPPYQFKVIRPSGWEEKVTPAFRGSDVILELPQNRESGTYKIEQAGKPLHIFSVNHSADESLQEYYGKDDMLETIGKGLWITDSENLSNQIEFSRYGRELWPYLLGIALLLLIIELILGYTSSRNQKNLIEPDMAEVSQT
jgi:hypothetical protein